MAAFRPFHAVCIMVFLGFTFTTDAYSPSWRKYFRTAAGVYYRYYGIAMNWQSAQRHCEKDGGHLAIVDTPQKVHFVMRKVMDDVWLGLKKSGRGWKWIDGASLRGGNWAAGEPNGGVCVYAMQMKKWMKDRDDGKWKDDSCALVKPFLCEGASACVAKNPCQNGGKCVASGKSTTSCQCPAGFEGVHCERDRRPCIGWNPCKNAAHCVNKGATDYTCSCPAGFQGKNCEIDKRPCIAFNPCQNGAHCNNKGMDYSCSCATGIQGKNCEIDKRPCIAWNPCQNGAHCTNKGGTDYHCACPVGFHGKNCDEDKRPCFTFNPCQNHGHCISHGADYSCKCSAGFIGKNCETDRRPCIAFNPCNNGARCVNKGADFACICQRGFEGVHCEIDKRPCIAFDPCLNGGVCHSHGTSYTCQCANQYKGKNCEQACHTVTQGGLPKKLDVIFLVDGSVSVKPGPFHKGLEFINKIIDHLDISNDFGRVGFVQFAHKIDTSGIISLGASVRIGKTALKTQILRSRYLNGGTQVCLALDEALSMFAREARPADVSKYVMVLSDGASSDTARITAAMNKIASAHVETFVIGVGEYSKEAESRRQLLEIAGGNSKRVFEVDDYDQLNDQILKQVLVSQCD